MYGLGPPSAGQGAMLDRVHELAQSDCVRGPGTSVRSSQLLGDGIQQQRGIFAQQVALGRRGPILGTQATYAMRAEGGQLIQVKRDVGVLRLHADYWRYWRRNMPTGWQILPAEGELRDAF